MNIHSVWVCFILVIHIVLTFLIMGQSHFTFSPYFYILLHFAIDETVSQAFNYFCYVGKEQKNYLSLQTDFFQMQTLNKGLQMKLATKLTDVFCLWKYFTLTTTSSWMLFNILFCVDYP